MTRRAWFACYLSGILLSPVAAQTISYPDPTLHYLYPAGGQRGQTVHVAMGPLPTLNGAKALIVDGPPGITVGEMKRVGDEWEAVLKSAPEAPPGRRLVRVLGGSNGLTNFRYFFVGQLPEVMEKEPNHTPATAQEIPIPAVVNGRINPDLDMDCFRFQAKAGQRIVAAVLAHGMDTFMYGGVSTGGYLDTV